MQTKTTAARTPKEAQRKRGPVDRVLRPEVFRALGDPQRVQILACLAKCGRACAVSEIAECCAVDLSVVSRHLSSLRAAGVVASEREGRVVRYRVRYAEVSAWLRAVADALEGCACAECSSAAGSCGCGCC